MKKTIIGLSFIIVMIAGFAVNIYVNPEQKAQRLTVFSHALELTDFSLVSHKGDEITQDTLKGRWSLLFFGYTFCPDVCPTTLSLLKRMHKGLPENMKDTNMILVSVDPERDTPEKLAPYLEYFGSEFGAITGDLAQITTLSTELHTYFKKAPLTKADGTVDTEHYLVDHSANIAIINPEGKYQGYLKAPFTVEQLINDYEVLRNNLP
jgi:protein SCO1/2